MCFSKLDTYLRKFYKRYGTVWYGKVGIHEWSWSLLVTIPSIYLRKSFPWKKETTACSARYHSFKPNFRKDTSYKLGSTYHTRPQLIFPLLCTITPNWQMMADHTLWHGSLLIDLNIFNIVKTLTYTEFHEDFKNATMTICFLSKLASNN